MSKTYIVRFELANAEWYESIYSPVDDCPHPEAEAAWRVALDMEERVGRNAAEKAKLESVKVYLE